MPVAYGTVAPGGGTANGIVTFDWPITNPVTWVRLVVTIAADGYTVTRTLNSQFR
jgi:hypothetical protein